MSILFINGSPNKKGNTARLAAALLGSRDYETLNLTDYRINVYGQRLAGDQFDEVMAKIKAADTIVIGSPLYWHNICGSVRTCFRANLFRPVLPSGSVWVRILQPLPKVLKDQRPGLMLYDFSPYGPIPFS